MIVVPPRSPFLTFLLTKPPAWFSWLICAISFALVGILNVHAFAGRPAGIAYALPLLLCLWSRSRLQLYAMALLGCALAYYKTVITGALGDDPTLRHLTWSLQILNLWIPALAIHLAMYSFDRLDLKRKLLLEANDELNDANTELATREEEALQQNNELQAQADELGRQTEELRQQAEELEQQAMELHSANDELTRRERGLQTLLESARWLRSDLNEADVMSAVCQAAVQVMEEGVSAAAVVHKRDGKLALRGHYGFGVHGTLREEVPFDHTFAALVIERGQTAYIADVSTRPDIVIPRPAAGRPFQSILCTPLTIDGRTIGVVEVYAFQSREWADGEFKVIEWLAAQCALALQAIEYQQEVVVKRREAEAASIEKTRFLAAISHDVRTPANAISLMADLIEQTAERASATSEGSDETSRVARSELPALARDLKANARALVELVSDVLDLSRLDTGQLDLQFSDFALLPVLQNEINQFKRIAAEKKLRLTLHALPENLHLRTDRMKLARVVANLVGNAVKFTQTGAVDLRTRRRADGALVIEVADTGMGIPQDALPRIFDEFYQLQNPERDRNKGSGLGLAICKRLVDALGCQISVESIPGVGTTFAITLPPDLISTAKPSPDPRPRPPAAIPTLENVKVLLVEDHDVTRRAAARLLAGAGATILEARNGREAIHHLVHDQPNVLLLDLMLPDADGADILKYLRPHRPPALKCVLAVSGDVRDARIAEVRELGADDLLAKPLDIDKLLHAITQRLALSRADGSPASHNRPA